MADLSTTYMGLKLKNPIIAGSSGVTDNIESLVALQHAGASAVVLKSLFEEEILQELQANMAKMTSDMFLYPETVDYYEYLDAPKESPEKYLSLIRDAKHALNIPVIASINCVSAGQWTYFPKRIEAAGADALELNLFVLPSDFERSAAENEKVYFDIIREVLKQVSIPVSIKVSPYFSNLGQTLQKFSETGIKGLVLFNRFYNPDIDIDKLQTTSGYVLSSPSDIANSLRWIAIMSQRAKCDLASSTGIHDARGAIKQLLAGASAIQVASVLYKQGPKAIENIVNGLQTWMAQKGFNNIPEFRAKLSQSNSINPAAYERVQFMKFFREEKPA